MDILLGWAPYIVTTNYDLCIEKRSYYRYRTISSCYDFNKKEHDISKGLYVLHLHGCVDKPETMVITDTDYFNLYYDKEQSQKPKELFNELFSGKYTILFIGSGLNDLELRTYLQKSYSKSFFLINPYCGIANSLISHMSEYYETINVKQIPYNIDNKGYSTLLDLLEEWNQYIKKQSSINVNVMDAIDGFFLEAPDQQSMDYLGIYIKEPLYSPYIFNNLSKSKYRLEWAEKIFSELIPPKQMIRLMNEGNKIVYNATCTLVNEIKSTKNQSLIKLIQNLIKLMDEESNNINEQYEKELTPIMFDLITCCKFWNTTGRYFKKIIDKEPLMIEWFIQSIIKNDKRFLKLSLEDNISIISDLIQCFPDDLDNIDTYYLDLLINNIISKEQSKFHAETMDEIICIIEKAEQNTIGICLDMGSVKQYVKSSIQHNSHPYLIKWFSIGIKFAKKDHVRNFIEKHINSPKHTLSTLALHTI